MFNLKIKLTWQGSLIISESFPAISADLSASKQTEQFVRELAKRQFPKIGGVVPSWAKWKTRRSVGSETNSFEVLVRTVRNSSKGGCIEISKSVSFTLFHDSFWFKGSCLSYKIGKRCIYRKYLFWKQWWKFALKPQFVSETKQTIFDCLWLVVIITCVISIIHSFFDHVINILL